MLHSLHEPKFTWRSSTYGGYTTNELLMTKKKMIPDVYRWELPRQRENRCIHNVKIVLTTTKDVYRPDEKWFECG